MDAAVDAAGGTRRDITALKDGPYPLDWDAGPLACAPWTPVSVPTAVPERVHAHRARSSDLFVRDIFEAGFDLEGSKRSETDMSVFKAVQPPALTTVHSDSDTVVDLMSRHRLTYAEALFTVRANDSWDLLTVPDGPRVTVAETCARLDAFDAAIAHEFWLARMTAGAGYVGVASHLAAVAS